MYTLVDLRRIIWYIMTRQGSENSLVIFGSKMI
jgi:hypothetical protein